MLNTKTEGTTDQNSADFATKCQLGSMTGISQIFSGFDDTQLAGSQIIDSVFNNISIALRVANVIYMADNSQLLIQDTNISAVSTRFIFGSYAHIRLINLKVWDFGLGIMEYLDPVSKSNNQLTYQERFNKVLQIHLQQQGHYKMFENDGYYKNLMNAMNDRFLWLNQGTARIEKSSFDHIATLVALIWVNNEGRIQIVDSKFQNIVGLVQSSLIFSIQNP